MKFADMMYSVIGNQQIEKTNVTMATIFVTARRFFDHFTTLDFCEGGKNNTMKAKRRSYRFAKNFAFFLVNIIQKSCVGEQNDCQWNKIIQGDRVNPEMFLQIFVSEQNALSMFARRQTVMIIERRSQCTGN